MNLRTLAIATATILVAVSAHAQSKGIVVTTAAPAGQRRMALVVGNSAYPGDLELRNPINDARAMAAKLLGLGFQVTERENLKERDLRVAIDTFAAQLGHDDVGLFYFSGHGAQFAGQNYLVPVDANDRSLDYLKDSSVPLQEVLDDLRQAGNGSNFVFLDACRNTPGLARRRGFEGGLALPRQVPVGTFIGFATAPGETAEDGSGHHGPFTQALLDHLSAPGLTADQVFHKVVNEVYVDTHRRQRPWSQSSLTQDFYFAEQATPSAATATPPSAEQLAWASIATSTDPQDFADFLKLYPNGPHAGVAKLREEHLLREGAESGKQTKAKPAVATAAKQQAKPVAPPVAKVQAGPVPPIQAAKQAPPVAAKASLAPTAPDAEGAGASADEQTTAGHSHPSETVWWAVVSVAGALYANDRYTEYKSDQSCLSSQGLLSESCHNATTSELQQAQFGGYVALIGIIGAIASYHSDPPSTASRGFDVEPSLLPEPGRPALALRVSRRW